MSKEELDMRTRLTNLGTWIVERAIDPEWTMEELAKRVIVLAQLYLPTPPARPVAEKIEAA